MGGTNTQSAVRYKPPIKFLFYFFSHWHSPLSLTPSFFLIVSGCRYFVYNTPDVRPPDSIQRTAAAWVQSALAVISVTQVTPEAHVLTLKVERHLNSIFSYKLNEQQPFFYAVVVDVFRYALLPTIMTQTSVKAQKKTKNPSIFTLYNNNGLRVFIFYYFKNIIYLSGFPVYCRGNGKVY